MKRSHQLDASLSPDDFLVRFEAEVGTGLPAFAGELLDQSLLSATILGGSIPLGLATGASDVDLMLIVDSPDPVPMPAVDRQRGVIFSGAFAGAARLDVGEVIVMREGIEIDVHLVSGPRVAEAAASVARGTISLTEHEIGVLSRIKTGWLLDRRDSFDQHCAELLADNSLEIRTATWHLVGALQELEDARAALADSMSLALHLGRKCVEKTCAALFAARGFAYLGSKWLRAFEPTARPTSWTADQRVQALGRAGIDLLFPAPAGGARDYLDQVSQYIDLVRTEIQKDMPFRIAFAISPQIPAPAP